MVSLGLLGCKQGRYRAAQQGNEAPTVHFVLMQSQPREKLAQPDPAADQ